MQPHPKTNSKYKSGFIAIMGRTNVGKSTLINAILGQKIAAISPRPQTTRRNQLGIYTSDQAQMIFIDTPGLHQPRHKLGERMVEEAKEALSDSDVILFMVDITEPPAKEDRDLAELVKLTEKTSATLVLFNKIDLVEREDQRNEQIKRYQELLPETKGVEICATNHDSVITVIEKIIDLLPEGPQYYPPDQITDLYERDIAADLIRASALMQLRDEIPHGIAIRIDQYTEREDHGAYIRATLFVEKESHKGIVIGQKGSMLKSIGMAARQEIEAMSGRKVYLELNVKVRKNWRNNENALNSFGFRAKHRSKGQ
jgi:GTPase